MVNTSGVRHGWNSGHLFRIGPAYYKAWPGARGRMRPWMQPYASLFDSYI